LQILNTFSKIIATSYINIDDDLYDRILEVKNETPFWSKKINDDNTEKSAGSSGSENWSILEIEKLSDLKSKVLNEFYIFKNEHMGYIHNDFRLTTSWFTSTAPGDKCDFHTHYHCMYSGVLYIKAEKNSGNIVFDPHEDYRFDLKVENFNINNSHSWWIPPEKGRIIFFDSKIHHKIEENKSNKERISIAFNLIPIGEMGFSDSRFVLG
jgi:uncharacterized protein (TIGR02466 family)